MRSELKAEELVNLPVSINRNYQYLFRVLPGFTPPAEAHSVPSNPSRALVFNVNGASRSSNNIRIDGVSTTNVWLPHVAAYVPALESLEAVNVVTNSFDAEQGLAGELRNQRPNQERDQHDARLGVRVPHQRGAPVAGAISRRQARRKAIGNTTSSAEHSAAPVVRNRFFYFASYEGTRDRKDLNRTVSVPTEAVRRGDLSVSTLPIYNPFTGENTGAGRTAFANNQIPQDRFDQTARQAACRFCRCPTCPTPTAPCRRPTTISSQAPFILNRHTLDTKVNWSASDKLNFFGRYSVLDFVTENGTNFGKELQGQPLGSSNPGRGEGNTYNFSVGSTYTLSPTDGDGCARRIRADEFRGGAVGPRGVQGT